MQRFIKMKMEHLSDIVCIENEKILNGINNTYNAKFIDENNIECFTGGFLDKYYCELTKNNKNKMLMVNEIGDYDIEEPDRWYYFYLNGEHILDLKVANSPLFVPKNYYFEYPGEIIDSNGKKYYNAEAIFLLEQLQNTVKDGDKEFCDNRMHPVFSSNAKITYYKHLASISKDGNNNSKNKNNDNSKDDIATFFKENNIDKIVNREEISKNDFYTYFVDNTWLKKETENLCSEYENQFDCEKLKEEFNKCYPDDISKELEERYDKMRANNEKYFL